MIRSMTGYGRGSSTTPGFMITVELRSVNHRYADFMLKIPREFYPLEDQVRQLLQKEVRRGRLEASITLEETAAGMQEISVNYRLAQSYYQALQQLSENLSLPLDAGVSELARLPDVIRAPGISLSEDRIWPSLEEALKEALARLLQRRQEEGKNLGADLLERRRQVARHVRMVADRAPLAREEHRVRIENRLKEHLVGQFDENRVLMECAALIERMGIDEELVRLESHLEAFETALSGASPLGRKLDFMAQEMFREINTIGAKASDFQIAGLVVEMKAEMEKIREQVQNIE